MHSTVLWNAIFSSNFFSQVFFLHFFVISRLFSGSAPRLISADLFTLIYHVESGLSRLQYQTSFKKLTFFFRAVFFVRFFFSTSSFVPKSCRSLYFLPLSSFFSTLRRGWVSLYGGECTFFTEVDFQIIFFKFLTSYCQFLHTHTRPY